MVSDRSSPVESGWPAAGEAVWLDQRERPASGHSPPHVTDAQRRRRHVQPEC